MDVVAVELDVEKLLFRTWLRMCLWLNLICGASLAIAADFSPIIPLPTSGSELPLLDMALRDPELASRRLTDDIYVQRALEEVDAQSKELGLARGNRRLELLSDLYKNEALLAYFFEDLKAGRLNIQGNYGSPEQKLKETRASLISHATDFARESKDRRAHAVYHAMVAKYLNGDTSKPDSLLRISKQLSKGLQARVQFMVAAARAQRNDSAAKQDVASSIGRMGREGSIAGNLLLAKAEAARNSDSYRSYLNRATAATKSLSRRDREKVLAFALNIWKAEEGTNADWNRAPLNLKQNKDSDMAKAVAERSALQASAQGNLTPAMRYYRGLVESSKGQARLTLVSDRILDLEAAQYQQSKNVKPYQKSLIAFQEMFNTEGSLGANQEAAAKAQAEKIRLRHRNLISQMISNGKQNSSDSRTKSDAIAAATVFLNGHAVDAEKVALKTDIGRLYALNDQHGEAVRVFMELKAESQGPAVQQYLLLAMQSQRALAKWTEKAPWQGIVQGQNPARQVLAQMYEERLQTTGSWDDLAHLGLLYIQLDQTGKAYAIWTNTLQKNAQGGQAQLAGGMMLNAYKKGRQWQKLEDLSRIAIKMQMAPVFQSQRLDAVALLGDALFEGGKEHFAAARYEKSSVKLAEFTKVYKTDFRRPEGMFVLGKAYHMSDKHPLSVETLFALVNEYPACPFDHDALLLGGNWSIPMAWEEQTIFFYQRFADRYARDAKAPQIRMTLVELYMGRELYGNAVRAHAAQVADSQVSRADQIKSALAVMHIEERFGEAKHAYWGVTKARELSGNNPQVLAEVLAFEARQAASKNDFPKLRQLEAQLSGLGIQDANASEGLALTRFVLADKESEQTKQDIFNLEQTDPYQTLQAQYALFLKSKSSFEKVCAAGTSSYCGLAMLRLSETTRNSLSAIENLSVAQTLDESIVRKFDQQKLAIINVISQTSSQADSIALGISEKGETLPDWSQEIVVNSSEGNLDRAHGAIGNGYVQWMPVKTDRE